MVKKIFSLLCLSLSLTLSNAQFTFRAKFVDADTNIPMPGVVITLKNPLKTFITGNDGLFQFETTSDTPLLISAYLMGYKTVIDTLAAQGPPKTIFLIRSPYIQNEVIINSTRAGEKSGVAYVNFTREQIEDQNNGRDIPYMLQNTPSLVATSDAGTGIGYTGVRIRGTDATRINVTLNGIPLNDAESQQLYWVDLPDLASSSENIQIQRGVGTSTNGAGAFGGSINILSMNPGEKPYASTSNAFGSFGTFKNNILAGTGMLDGKWNIEGRFSKINSDGYIDRATSDLESAYLSAGYYSKRMILKAVILSGKETTYQSWLGVPEYALDTNRTLNLYTYENQVDDYKQDHYQFFWAYDAGKNWTLNAAAHYTAGSGYYEEYKEDQNLNEYGLAEVIVGSDTITQTDLVRRKWLDNDFYGVTWSAEYEPQSKLNFTIGGAANRYDGDHFGKVIWAEYSSNGGPDHEYYRNTGIKTDINVFIKAGYDITDHLHIYGDLQGRTIGYDFTGIDDEGNALPQSDRLNFFNPKAGIHYRINDKHQTYLSLGVANKEPARNDYVDNPRSQRPEHETLVDLETGYRMQNEKISGGLNLYYMYYKNQLAVTGKLNDTGDPVRVNLDKSYRAGIEADIRYVPVQRLTLNGNITLSENKIDSYQEIIYNYDDGSVIEKTYSNTDLAFSPNITAYAGITYQTRKHLSASLHNRYIGKQYMDNTSADSRSLDSYFVTDLSAEYRLHPKFMKEITLSVWVNNIFDQLYESNGYTYSYIYGSELITENFYYPQAGTNFMIQLKLDF